MNEDINSVKELWNNAADSWSDFIESGKDYYKDKIIAPAILDLLPSMKNKGEKALDLCCGEGYYSRKLKDMGYEAYGVDISDKFIDIARQKNKEITYYSSDASKLNMFKNEYFDLVVCAMGLMDASDYKEIILEVKRVLKNKGYFIFSISHPCFSFEKGGWKRGKDGNKLFFKMDNYFLEDETTVDWNMQRLKYNFRIKTFHRTISTYFNFLSENGFIVEKLLEPYYNNERVPENSCLEDSRRIAYFLHVKCKKLTNNE